MRIVREETLRRFMARWLTRPVFSKHSSNTHISIFLNKRAILSSKCAINNAYFTVSGCNDDAYHYHPTFAKYECLHHRREPVPDPTESLTGAITATTETTETTPTISTNPTTPPTTATATTTTVTA